MFRSRHFYVARHRFLRQIARKPSRIRRFLRGKPVEDALSGRGKLQLQPLLFAVLMARICLSVENGYRLKTRQSCAARPDQQIRPLIGPAFPRYDPHKRPPRRSLKFRIFYFFETSWTVVKQGGRLDSFYRQNNLLYLSYEPCNQVYFLYQNYNIPLRPACFSQLSLSATSSSDLANGIRVLDIYLRRNLFKLMGIIIAEFPYLLSYPRRSRPNPMGDARRLNQGIFSWHNLFREKSD